MAYNIKATTRTVVGKGPVRRMRRDGSVPAVLYGHGDPSVLLGLGDHEFEMMLIQLRGHSPIVDLAIDDKEPLRCIIKTLQRNPVSGKLLHVDFQKVHAGEKITIEVPVVLHGTPEGTKMGGILEYIRREVPVHATIDMIPEHFDVDVTHLNVGNSIHISDLNRPDLEFGLPPESAIVTVLVPRKIEVAAATPEAAAGAEGAEAAPTEPEVIKEKKGAEEEPAEEEKGKKGAKEEKKPAKDEKKK
jgi:large subunit ribosomal protein L25